MRPAKPMIRICPSCSKPFRQEAWSSFNTFGLLEYTDGKCEAPMLPEIHAFVICPECSAGIWLEDAREVRRFEGRQIVKLPAFLFDDADRYKRINDGIVEGYSPDPEYEQTKFSITPRAQDYWAALASGAADTIERERYLRIRIWRAGNDSRRGGGRASSLSSQECGNLKALCELCSEADDQQWLVKAKAMRELGNFGETLRLLERPFTAHEVAGVVATIRRLAERGDSAVALVSRGVQ